MRSAVLVIASVVASVLLVEAGLRVLPASTVYSGRTWQPTLNQQEEEVRFWDRYRGGVEDANAAHDPLLGWDLDRDGDRVRGGQYYAATPQPGVLRVVAVGDSFTFGTDVGPHENFCAQLQERYAGVEVLNMGVPGYGIDQAYLKYRQHGVGFAPDVVLFGIYVGDYERASIAFHTFAKPKLVLEEGALRTLNTPVPGPASELLRIGAMIAAEPRVFTLVRTGWSKAIAGEADKRRYFEATDAVVVQMLRELSDSLSDGQRLLVLHIRRAEAYVERDAIRDETSRRLLAIYADLGVEHVDLGTAFLEAAPAAQVYSDYYVHEADGSVGHLSGVGHARAADLVAARLALSQKPGRSRTLPPAT